MTNARGVEDNVFGGFDTTNRSELLMFREYRDETTENVSATEADSVISPADFCVQVIQKPDFMRKAACLGTDPGIFVTTTGQDQTPAKEVCKRCVVIGECLDYAMEDRSLTGVWGGTSERQRKHMRKDSA